ncbi:MAG: T9SS type A sorting domain-containing protein [Flavobacteriales bacterium]|nr:T9SS type A sorting domain-containing protein [Flavobacteriales bacterium]
MITLRQSLILGTCALSALNLMGQVEILAPLQTRPVPEALEAQRKSEGLNTYFIYQYATQQLPVQDDFSIDRTRKRWAQPGEAGVTLTNTIYQLEVGGSSTWDMEYSSDTTFLYTTDLNEPVTTTRTPLTEVTVTVRNLTLYPPTESNVQAWPPYNVFDTIQNPSPDIFPLTGDLVQDSLMVYTVAPASGTYTNPDGSVVPMVLWQDDDVYVNATYPIDPPTVGVATFDGLARNGYPYNFAQYSAHGIADKLTSVPINLSANIPADSLYLSFFYQPQGLSGDINPQPQDSLVLELYAPDEETWYRVWRTPYLPLQPFEQVLVPITLTKFLKPDFQFRFLNYATLSGSFDHWHLDYVRLGAQRTFDDTRLIDVAYVMPESSLLETYTSVPFNRFAAAPAAYMAPSVTLPLKNLDNQDRFITYGMLAKEENAAPVSLFSNGLSSSGNASTTIPSLHPVNSAPNNFTYDPSLSTDAAFWRVKFWRTNTMPDINRYNDTTAFIQELSNYLAYDDGSAEMGYSLNVAGAMLAYRFDIVGEDSLRAVRLYFNPQANDPASSPNPLQGSFLLTIWSSITPEAVIHRNFSFSSPEYRLEGLNRFVEYPLDVVVPVSGTFYVGWTQTTGTRMNLGFDRNRNNQNKIFYKTGLSFQSTTHQGSLMMRPVFVSAYDPFTGLPDNESGGTEMRVYPNPASDAVVVVSEAAGPGSTVQIVDATGRLAAQEPFMNGRPIQTAALGEGLYVLRILSREGQPVGQQRLVIQR